VKLLNTVTSLEFNKMYYLWGKIAHVILCLLKRECMANYISLLDQTFKG